MPAELEALFPPPACTVPIEFDASLSPAASEAGASTVALVLLATTVILGWIATEDTWAVPVESEAELLPPDGCPVGADARALLLELLTFTLGLAVTEPTWTVPIESLAEFPEPASAGAAVARTAAAAHTPTTRP